MNLALSTILVLSVIVHPHRYSVFDIESWTYVAILALCAKLADWSQCV
jgi:hypothetical protein